MFVSVAVALALVAIVSCLLYSRQKHQYWASRGIWSPKALPILGHLIEMMIKKQRWKYIDKIYVDNKEKKYWGMYMNFKPSIIIADPEIIKLVVVKDADSFVDRPMFDLGKSDILFKEFLSIMPGERWKALRSILSPTFTSGKIKGTFPLVSESVETLLKHCNIKMEEDGHIDARKMYSQFSMDVITNCALGIRVDCYANEKSEFLKACYEIMNFTYIDILKLLMIMNCRRIFYGLGFSFAKPGMFILEKGILKTIKLRQESNTRRGDFLDIQLEALKKHDENVEDSKYPMTMTTVVATSILFVLAGYDTTSTTLSFTTYLLAKNTDCQDELRKEIQEIRDSQGEINYQNVMEAKYLDACIFETLRMFPPLPILERRCTRDYDVPSHDLFIPKDMTVGIPVWSMHYDSQYWDEPLKYKPERFLPENKQYINQYAFYGFGQGPRNCIGMRFALMEAKLALAHMVLNFEMSLKPGFELKLVGGGIDILKPDTNGIHIILEPVEENILQTSDQQSD